MVNTHIQLCFEIAKLINSGWVAFYNEDVVIYYF